MSTEIQKTTNKSLVINEKSLQIADNIDNIVLAVAEQIQNVNPFKRALIKATAIKDIKIAMDKEYMENILVLKNTTLGFLTDEKEHPYKESIVKNCVIEATLTGLEVTGNQFNILAGRMYVTKFGFNHLLKKIPTLSGQEITFKQVEVSGEIATVTTEILWTLDGKQNKRTIRFSVRINKGMSHDGILGKTERKAKAWLYNAITENNIGDGDIEDVAHVVIIDNNSNQNNNKENRGSDTVEVVDESTGEVKTLSEIENRALNYIKKSTNKEDLETRVQTIKNNNPEINTDYLISISQLPFLQ